MQQRSNSPHSSPFLLSASELYVPFIAAVAAVACVGFLAYHSEALLNNRQFLLGEAVDPMTLCPSGRFQFHSFKKVGGLSPGGKKVLGWGSGRGGFLMI